MSVIEMYFGLKSAVLVLVIACIIIAVICKIYQMKKINNFSVFAKALCSKYFSTPFSLRM